MIVMEPPGMVRFNHLNSPPPLIEDCLPREKEISFQGFQRKLYLGELMRTGLGVFQADILVCVNTTTAVSQLESEI